MDPNIICAKQQDIFWFRVYWEKAEKPCSYLHTVKRLNTPRFWTSEILVFTKIQHHHYNKGSYLHFEYAAKGASTPASFTSLALQWISFSHLVRFVWEGLNGAIALGCTTKEDQTRVLRFSFKSRSQYTLRAWMKQWFFLHPSPDTIQTHTDKTDARNINICIGSSHMCCVSPDEPERVPGHVAGGSDQEC